MIIETRTAIKGFFFVTFEDADFKRRDETARLVWRSAIEWLKADISPEQRNYDDQTREWQILDTPDNGAIVTSLYR